MTAHLTTRRFTAQSLWLALVFITAVAVYSHTIGHGFAFDDGVVIEKNLDIRSLSNLPQIFSHTEWEGGGLENYLYRPLTTTTYALNYAVGGLSPWGYHLVNVLLHGVVSALLVLLGLRWRLPLAAAGVGALWFAVHPIHVEAVANVIGRKELLATLFLILMVFAHRAALLRGGWAFAWPVLAFIGAMMSKEVGVVGLGLMALHDVVLREGQPEPRGPRQRSVALYLTYAVALAGFLLLYRTVVGPLPADRIPFIDNPLVGENLPVRLMTAIAVLGKGLGLQLLPLHQSADYSYNAIPAVRSLNDPRFVAALVLIGLWIWVGYRLRRRTPVLLLGGGWYVLTILPASNLLFPVGTIFGERLLYAPSAGLILVLAWAACDLLGGRWRRGYWLLAGVIALALAFGTVRYTHAWRDPLHLFRWSAHSVPDAARVHHKLGEVYAKQREYRLAESELLRSLEIYPRGTHSLGLVADIYAATGRPDEASSQYEKVLDDDPRNAPALYGLGRLERDLGNLEAAALLWQRALESDPRQSGALADLGTLAYSDGDFDRAREYWEKAVLYEPLLASAWYNLGLLYRQTGQREKSDRAFREFLRTAGPEYTEAVRYVEALLNEE